MAYISNVVQRTLNLLASQFQGTTQSGDLTNFQKLIKSFSLSSQEIQDVLEQLKSERNIDVAVGVQLDGLGQIIGLERLGGQDDEDYREALKFQIFINRSNGTPEEMIRILKFFTNASKIRFIEYYPASYQMITNGTTFPDIPEDIVNVIQSSSPASVQYVPITATYGVEVPFVFSGDANIELLSVTDPADSTNLVNLETDTTDLLVVNASNFTPNPEGGGFAEYGSPSIDSTGAGQLCEVFYKNGSIPPTP